MIKYLIKRILWMIPMLIGISLISFFIMHLAPGDITSSEASFKIIAMSDMQRDSSNPNKFDEIIHDGNID